MAGPGIASVCTDIITGAIFNAGAGVSLQPSLIKLNLARRVITKLIRLTSWGSQVHFSPVVTVTTYTGFIIMTRIILLVVEATEYHETTTSFASCYHQRAGVGGSPKLLGN